MLPNAIHTYDLLEISKLIREREVTSETVTAYMLDRITRLDPSLHSYMTVMADQALAAAQAADAELAAGRYHGALHGVPIAIKDLFSTKGVRTTHGMRVLNDNIPAANATVVERLEEAGAVILGKTTMSEGAHGDNHPDFPTPLNPWNAMLWAGTSSNGSGVASAAELCFGSLGSDTGGSVRFPAAANGLTAMKTTWGRVSRSGVYEMGASLDTVGPIARSVGAVAALLQAIAGRDPRDATSSFRPVPDYLAGLQGGIAGLRIGVDRQWAMDSVDRDTAKTLNDALEVLLGLGAIEVPVVFPDRGAAVEDWVPLCAVESAVAHAKLYATRPADFGDALSGFLELGAKLTAMEYQRLLLRRAALRGHVQELFQSVDVLLAPVTAFAGLTVEDMKKFGVDADLFSGILRYTCPVNMTGNPALSLPAGITPTGAPVGIQLVGAKFSEELLLRVGHNFQKATHWHTLRSPLS